MASLKDVVKSYQEYLSKDITWVAFWKEEHSWYSKLFILVLNLNVNADEMMLLEQKKELEEILAKDPEAIILNGYYNHLRHFTITELYHYVCWYYKNGTSSKVKHFLEVTEVYNPQAETDETASIDEQQKTAFDKDSFLKSDFGSRLIEVITMWDIALNRNDSITENYCSAYWEAAQAALLFFTGTEYHFSRGDDYCGIVSADDGDWLFCI